MTMSTTAWRFFRAGGFDQVRLDTGAELLALSSLDQKLWVALSCPVKGLQFDERTLSLIDSDQDGHVRAPELLAAIHWAHDRLRDIEMLARGAAGVSLADLRDNEAGMALAEQARQLLADLGKSDADRLTVADVTQAQALFHARLKSAWEQARPADGPLGEATPEGYDQMVKVGPKIEDFFLRCRILAFDGIGDEALVSPEQRLVAVGGTQVQASALSDWPLARLDGAGRLPLLRGVNPAWQDDLRCLLERVVVPLLGGREVLLEDEWRQIKASFAPYAAWRDACPPADGEDGNVRDLEKLVRLVRDLLTLANNFVSFKAFYTREGKAIFQAGTLYLDGRSCELCVTVNDMARHALLASQAGICLVYCDCVRAGQKMTMVAAFTAGDADQLRVGRNGVFYDAKGQDWDATIARIVEHPISLRQAFWSPYKKVARAISDQVEKFASSRAKAVDDKLTAGATGAVAKTGAAAPAPAPGAVQQAFDVGKFAGIFAAIGMALGAIGTALASVMVGILSLALWQIPFALAGLLLAVSGPAMLLAWFKLRGRTLGPLLDANGWAINARAKINIPFGTSLTQLARLPANAERSLTDPYADEPRSMWTYGVWGALLLMVLAMLWSMKGGGMALH